MWDVRINADYRWMARTQKGRFMSLVATCLTCQTIFSGCFPFFREKQLQIVGQRNHINNEDWQRSRYLMVLNLN